MEKIFIEAFKNALERDEDIQFTDEFRTYEEWDSLTYLEIVAMLDEDFDVEIEEADFNKLITVEDLFNEVKNRSGK